MQRLLHQSHAVADYCLHPVLHRPGRASAARWEEAACWQRQQGRGPPHLAADPHWHVSGPCFPEPATEQCDMLCDARVTAAGQAKLQAVVSSAMALGMHTCSRLCGGAGMRGQVTGSEHEQQEQCEASGKPCI